MSKIGSTPLPVTHKFRIDVKISEFEVENHYEGSLTHCFHTPFINLCGVPWRWSIYQVRSGQVEPALAIAFRCGCDARSVFWMRVRQKWTVRHLEDRERDLSRETIVNVNNQEKIFIDTTSLPTVSVLEERDFIEVEDHVVFFTMEFELEIIQATSCALPAPKFTRHIEYHDVCLKVRNKEFWVSSNIIKIRCNHHAALLPRRNKTTRRVSRVTSSNLEEFLKLVYLYQDDITAANIDALLSLSIRFGSPECVYILEKFLFRTTQLSILDKILLGEKYRLDNVLKVYVQATTSPEKFKLYESHADFGRLSTELRREMKWNSEIPVTEPFDARLQIEWRADLPDDRRSLSKKFMARGVPFCLKIRRTQIPGHIGFLVQFDCLLTDYEYYMASIAVHVQVLVGENGRSEKTARKFLDTHCWGKWVFVKEERGPDVWMLRNDRPVTVVRCGFRLDDFRHQKIMSKCRQLRCIALVSADNASYLTTLALIGMKIMPRPHSHVFHTSMSPHWNVILQRDGHKFYVNKEILASVSQFFARLFAGSYRKRKSTFIFRDGLNINIFEEGLQHLYQPSRPIVNEHQFKCMCDFFKSFSSHKLMEDLDLFTLHCKSTETEKFDVAREHLFQNTLLTISSRHGADGFMAIARGVEEMMRAPRLLENNMEQEELANLRRLVNDHHNDPNGALANEHEPLLRRALEVLREMHPHGAEQQAALEVNPEAQEPNEQAPGPPPAEIREDVPPPPQPNPDEVLLRQLIMQNLNDPFLVNIMQRVQHRLHEAINNQLLNWMAPGVALQFPLNLNGVQPQNDVNLQNIEQQYLEAVRNVNEYLQFHR